MAKYVRVVIGNKLFGAFRYRDGDSKNLAIQKAIEHVFYWLGSDVDPWPYIKE